MTENLTLRECDNCRWIGTDECIECYREKHPLQGQYEWFWNQLTGKYEMAKLPEVKPD